MAIIPNPPSTVESTLIHKRMVEAAEQKDGVVAKCASFVAGVVPLLDLIIAGPFRDYTLHNRDHAKKVVHLMGVIAGAETISQLSKLECLILIYAAHLHDLGLVLTITERDRIVSSQEFIDYINKGSDFSKPLAVARNNLTQLAEHTGDEDVESEKIRLEALIYQYQEAALSEYLRPKHAQKASYLSLIERIKESCGQDLFSYEGISFVDELVLVCWSHNEDAGVLAGVKNAYEDTFPRDFLICGEKINLQFCAGLLRLSDILDFDRERTPHSLYQALGIGTRQIPGTEISFKEWQKHLAIHTIDIQSEEIVVAAKCSHPVIERAICEFSNLIEREIRDTTSVLKRNVNEVSERYRIELPLSVRPRIQSQGYIYKDMAFHLDQNSILNLLMGEKLYANFATPIRELLQNSIDACAVRARLDLAPFDPLITVSEDFLNDGESRITVEDNGVGMDERVLLDYFFNVGSSYYRSYEFRQLIEKSTVPGKMTPISRFGIGMISCFMIADSIEVTTRNSFSIRKDFLLRTLVIDAKGGLAFVTESEEEKQGTKVSITLKSSYNTPLFRRNILNYLQNAILRPAVPICIRMEGKDILLKAPERLKLSKNASKYLESIGVQAIAIDIGRWSDDVSGSVIIFLATHSDGILRNKLPNGQRISLRNNLDPEQCLIGYEKNRLTVNGIIISLKRASRLLGRDVACVIDADIIGGEKVEYNVARDKLTGAGAIFVRNRLRSAVTLALSEMDLLNRIEVNNHTIFDQQPHRTSSPQQPIKISEIIKTSIKDLLPDGPWPKDIHKSIAEKLGLSHNVVSRTLADLTSKGVASKPKDSK